MQIKSLMLYGASFLMILGSSSRMFSFDRELGEDEHTVRFLNQVVVNMVEGEVPTIVSREVSRLANALLSQKNNQAMEMLDAKRLNPVVLGVIAQAIEKEIAPVLLQIVEAVIEQELSQMVSIAIPVVGSNSAQSVSDALQQAVTSPDQTATQVAPVVESNATNSMADALGQSIVDSVEPIVAQDAGQAAQQIEPIVAQDAQQAVQEIEPIIVQDAQQAAQQIEPVVAHDVQQVEPVVEQTIAQQITSIVQHVAQAIENRTGEIFVRILSSMTIDKLFSEEKGDIFDGITLMSDVNASDNVSPVDLQVNDEQVAQTSENVDASTVMTDKSDVAQAADVQVVDEQVAHANDVVATVKSDGAEEVVAQPIAEEQVAENNDSVVVVPDIDALTIDNSNVAGELSEGYDQVCDSCKPDKASYKTSVCCDMMSNLACKAAVIYYAAKRYIRQSCIAGKRLI